MLKNGTIEPSMSDWSSPCVLVNKPDRSVRFGTDYWKVNAITKTDSYPIPQVDDCIDKVEGSTFIMKLDLLKSYWYIPLADRAKEIQSLWPLMASTNIVSWYLEWKSHKLHSNRWWTIAW